MLIKIGTVYVNPATITALKSEGRGCVAYFSSGRQESFDLPLEMVALKLNGEG